jgi:hypothetical protein
MGNCRKMTGFLDSSNLPCILCILRDQSQEHSFQMYMVWARVNLENELTVCNFKSLSISPRISILADNINYSKSLSKSPTFRTIRCNRANSTKASLFPVVMWTRIIINF